MVKDLVQQGEQGKRCLVDMRMRKLNWGKNVLLGSLLETINFLPNTYKYFVATAGI
jgi:hypothetical protein